MKASDYIVEYLIDKQITDVFGYPGGMVTHLMDSFSKRRSDITSHVMYHEQGAAFAACGYAQTSGKMGVAYATSGPGATNLVTGICNAFFDSIPVLFITGQVNTFETKGILNVRQRGFQETDIVSMVKSITKYAVKIEKAEDLKWHLEAAFFQAFHGRRGPVLLDIPMDIFRADVNPEEMKSYEASYEEINELKSIKREEYKKLICEKLYTSKRPVILLGNGIKISRSIKKTREVANKLGIPTVSTMLAVDVMPENDLNYGFIGAYGGRVANFITAKCDLLITLGARLDVRQTGANRASFASEATILRIDIDAGELEYKVHDNEIQICMDVMEIIGILDDISTESNFEFTEWLAVCHEIRTRLSGMDDRMPNKIIHKISEFIPEDAIMTTDVGQNQVWIAQSLKVKPAQKVLFSGGHGAMGYSLPASIGCAVATDNKKIFSFNGDGGIQMNLQELQTIVREKLPITIVLFNNSALGMIRHFQEMYFNMNYYQTVPQGGYTVPDFSKIARAYGITYFCVKRPEDVTQDMIFQEGFVFIEIKIEEETYVYPKLEFGKPNQDQEPLIDRNLYKYLCSL